MSVSLESVINKKTDFITRSIGGAKILAGASGDLVTLTPPAGQKVRLSNLSNVAGLSETNISVIIGGVDITGVMTLNGGAPNATSVFSVGSYQAYSAGDPPRGNYKSFTGGTDEVVIVRKTTGSLSNDLFYGYQFGE